MTIPVPPADLIDALNRAQAKGERPERDEREPLKRAVCREVRRGMEKERN